MGGMPDLGGDDYHGGGMPDLRDDDDADDDDDCLEGGLPDLSDDDDEQTRERLDHSRCHLLSAAISTHSLLVLKSAHTI